MLALLRDRSTIEADMSQLAMDIFELRSHALKDAVYQLHIREEADEWFLSKLRALGFGCEDKDVFEVVKTWLVRLFPKPSEPGELDSKVSSILRATVAQLGLGSARNVAELDDPSQPSAAGILNLASSTGRTQPPNHTAWRSERTVRKRSSTSPRRACPSSLHRAGFAHHR